MTSYFPTFNTKNIHFRQLQMSDAYGVYHLFSDTNAMALDGGQTMKSINDAYQFISYYSQIGQHVNFARWALVSRTTGEFYGTAGFHEWDQPSQSAEIGGELLKTFWNKGIASEAYQGLVAFGFEKMNLNRIYAYVNPSNKGAKRIMEKSPFKKEGYLRQCRRWGDQFVDLEVYGLIKEDIAMT